jgi:hypothetical protein
MQRVDVVATAAHPKIGIDGGELNTGQLSREKSPYCNGIWSGDGIPWYGLHSIVRNRIAVGERRLKAFWILCMI